MKERIFIVSDDPILLRTRGCLLQDWQTTVSSSVEAEEAIRTKPYDLLIFGHTVPDDTAKRLIEIASELHPSSTSLVICSSCGEDRHIGSATYRIDLTNPGGLKSAVATILNSRPDTGALRP